MTQQKTERAPQPAVQAKGLTTSTDAPSKVPPQFSLEASPVQMKAGSYATVQFKKPELTEEQKKLRAKFILFRDEALSKITDPIEKSSFQKRATEFIDDMDTAPWTLFGKAEAKWGTKKYHKALAKKFPDYKATLDGKTASFKASALKEARAAETEAQKTLAMAKEATALASTNVTLAEKAVAQAEAAAVNAEAAATRAETNAQSADADDADKAAAKKAREAATEARKAADTAKKALADAKTQSLMAGEQLKYANGNLDFIQTRIQAISFSTDVLQAQQYAKPTTLKEKTVSMQGAIEDTKDRSTEAAEQGTAAVEAANAGLTAAEKAEKASVPIKGLKGKFDAVKAAKDEKERKKAAQAVAELARKMTKEYPAKIKDFKAQATPTPKEKVRILGELTAASARIEWLVGTIYLGGSDDTDKWEETKNQDKNDVLAGYYHNSVSNKDSTGPWCSKFVAAVNKNTLGYKDKKGKATGSTWSGYKMARADLWDYDEAQGGDHTGKGHDHDKESQKELKDLAKAVKKAKKKEEKEKLVKDFFKNTFTPQPGDMMVVKRSSNPTANSYTSKALSHTTMIEKVDGTKIYTIEGNASNRVMGRVYDLATDADVVKPVFIGRMSLNAIPEDKKKEEPAAEGAPKAEATTYTEADLLDPVRRLSQKLQKFAEDQKYINKLKEGAVDAVYNIQQDNKGKGDT